MPDLSRAFSSPLSGKLGRLCLSLSLSLGLAMPAWADSGVALFSPSGTVKAVRQVRAQFAKWRGRNSTGVVRHG